MYQLILNVIMKTPRRILFVAGAIGIMFPYSAIITSHVLHLRQQHQSQQQAEASSAMLQNLALNNNALKQSFLSTNNMDIIDRAYDRLNISATQINTKSDANNTYTNVKIKTQRALNSHELFDLLAVIEATMISDDKIISIVPSSLNIKRITERATDGFLVDANLTVKEVYVR